MQRVSDKAISNRAVLCGVVAVLDFSKGFAKIRFVRRERLDFQFLMTFAA